MKYTTVIKLLISLIFLSFSISAQKVIVYQGEEKLDETKRIGLYTVLELDVDIVKNAWNKKLRDFGSVKSKSGIYTIEQATIGSISPTLIKVLSKIELTTKGVKLFYALDLGDAYVTAENDATKYKEAERILHDFGVEMYLADINQQIKDAEKVLMASVRDQEKMITKGENIKSSISDNRLEKMKLEKKLYDNTNNYNQLKTDSLQNVQNQNATAQTVEKMKRAVEAVRNKISKVE